MKSKRGSHAVAAMIIVAGLAAPAVMAQNQETLTAQGQEVKVPVPTEPGIFTIKGQFARIAYNNEGWVTLGYRTANNSQGTEWMLIEAGVTVRRPTANKMPVISTGSRHRLRACNPAANHSFHSDHSFGHCQFVFAILGSPITCVLENVL